MKKLLSLLSVLTISGTAVPTTIAASPYQKEKQENKLENIEIINKQISSQIENNNYSWWDTASSLWKIGIRKSEEFKEFLLEKVENIKNGLENLLINDLLKLFENKKQYNNIQHTRQQDENRIEINLNVPIIEQREGLNYCLAASIQMIFAYFNRNIIENSDNNGNGHDYSQERIYLDNASSGTTGCDISQNTADYIYNVLQQYMHDTTNNYDGQNFVFNSIPQNYLDSNFVGNSLLQQQLFVSYVLQSLYNNVPVIFTYFDQTLNGWHSIIINSISVDENNYSSAVFNIIDPNGPNEYSFDTNMLQNYLTQGGFLIGGSVYNYNNEVPDLQYYDFNLASHSGNLNYPQFDFHSLDDVMSCIEDNNDNINYYRSHNTCHLKPAIKIYYDSSQKNKELNFTPEVKNSNYWNTKSFLINLGKINPVENYKKIEFLGDTDSNCWGTMVNWGGWVYTNSCPASWGRNKKMKGESIKTFLENINNELHYIIENAKHISPYKEQELQNFWDKDGSAKIEVNQRFGLTWYWENDTYYLKVFGLQYCNWWASKADFNCNMKMGSGIKLYN